ncbi:MAG: hypothetical protein NVS9B14_16770 [Candidatus Acidiferrum sp.]
MVPVLQPSGGCIHKGEIIETMFGIIRAESFPARRLPEALDAVREEGTPVLPSLFDADE